MTPLMDDYWMIIGNYMQKLQPKLQTLQATMRAIDFQTHDTHSVF